ncbi:expressed unknown protein [Seminavis robusta]|uniref:Uncharacterized protein n=1 Tax=Seminavis robusta TaxID=568900 RepID=A0A9N8HIM6_9STRA|nr:expressed unknown protein [Seminavis robusta]|eukprot:Sro509_g157060.1 n/a (106) ;mRNA; r:32758-33075
MANDFAIADGVPMGLEDMRGIPVALRRQGGTEIKCPYCGKMHYHPPGSGHNEAQCDEDDRCSVGIVVGERSFVPNYGYTIVEYLEKDGVNKILPIDEDSPTSDGN